MPKYDSEYFREKFPNLYKEIENDTKSVGIDGVRTDRDEGEKAAKHDRSSGPSVVDFIRLCETEEDAVEIINHIQEQGKISEDHARELRNQLARDGLRSFGSKREPGEYSFTD